MRKLRKTAAAVAMLGTVIGLNAITAFAADDTITVSVRIEGTDSTMYYQSVEVSSNSTVEELLKEADDANGNIDVTMSAGYGGGYYVSGINSLNEAAYGGYEGWNYMVNGEIPAVGISSCTLKDGDTVVLYYADSITAGIQYPVADTSKIEDGVITFTSTDTVYDANWNASTVVNPVANATVTWYYGDTFATYTTDENGAIKIDASQLTSGDHKLQIEKYNENGLPLVLRYASDYSVNVEQDVKTGDSTSLVTYICMSALAACAYALVSKRSDKEKTC